jgi:hypothetical protein
MLEHGELVLRPWAPARADGPAAPTRHIRAGRGGAALGFAVRRRAEGWPFWPWARPERFEVFETEDESLLMTVTRGWADTWKVRDADERLVGQIRGGFVYDGAAECLAERAASEEGQGRLVSGDETLAEWVRYEDGVRLLFADRLEKEPFAKMVLLAAVLTAEE